MRYAPHSFFVLSGLALSALLPCEAHAAPHGSRVKVTRATRTWPNVKLGDQDELNFRVTIVQYLLRAHSASVPVTGHFGSQTQRAVRRFQHLHGLPQTGIVTSRTWQVLIVSLREGSRGDAVRAVQTVLHDVAAPTVSVDGRFGALTTRAVRSFQTDSGLTVDGMVGAQTWQALTANFFD